MRKVFIHIGYPKTATTALQSFFYTNPQILKDNNIYYPLKGIAVPEKGHHNLVRAIASNPHTTNLYKPELGDIHTVSEEIKNRTENIIISSEGFSHLFNQDPKKVHKYLKTAFKAYEIEYLIVVRKADEFIESSFFQRLNAWSRGRLKTQLPDIKASKNKHLRGELNYLRVLNKVLSIEAKVTVFTYTNNIVNELANYIMQPPSPITVPKISINKRQGKKLLSLLYTLATHDKQTAYQQIFIKNKKKIIYCFSEEEQEKYGIFTKPERSIILEKYAKKIQDFNTRYNLNISIPQEDKSEKHFFLVDDFNERQQNIARSIFKLELKKTVAKEIINL